MKHVLPRLYKPTKPRGAPLERDLRLSPEEEAVSGPPLLLASPPREATETSDAGNARTGVPCLCRPLTPTRGSDHLLRARLLPPGGDCPQGHMAQNTREDTHT